jgi:hypothetical protein
MISSIISNISLKGNRTSCRILLRLTKRSHPSQKDPRINFFSSFNRPSFDLHWREAGCRSGTGSGSRSYKQDPNPDPHQSERIRNSVRNPPGPRRALLLCMRYHAPQSRKDETRKTSTSGTLFYCTEFKPVTAGYPVSSEQYPHWPYLLLYDP